MFFLQILKCISHLELLQLIGSGVKDQNTTAMKKSAVLDNNPSKSIFNWLCVFNLFKKQELTTKE